jgi:hypothetical protein
MRSMRGVGSRLRTPSAIVALNGEEDNAWPNNWLKPVRLAGAPGGPGILAQDLHLRSTRPTLASNRHGAPYRTGSLLSQIKMP